MIAGLDLVSVLLGAGIAAAATASLGDGPLRRSTGVGLSAAAVIAALLSHSPPLLLGLAAAALLASGAAALSWLRDHRPVRLDADELRLHRLVFREMTAAQFKELVDTAAFIDVGDGEVLIKDGKAPSFVLLLLRGEARVRVDGEDRLVLTPGRFAGELGWVTGRRNAGAVVASGEVQYLEWRRADLERLFGRRPQLRALFNIAVAKDLADKLSLG